MRDQAGDALEGRGVRLTELAAAGSTMAQVIEIFFQSSSRTVFASTTERQDFLQRWTGYYFEHCPHDVWLWQETDGTVAGYLTGCRDSGGAEALFRALPAYGLFEPRFVDFPAHLHVNCRSDRRNVGIGARLVEKFVEDCRQTGLIGVHVVTAPTARNVGFYHRIGFTVHETKTFGDKPLLFMGRRLKPEAKGSDRETGWPEIRG